MSNPSCTARCGFSTRHNAVGLLVLLAISLGAQAAGPDISDKVRANVDARIESCMTPGMVIGLVDQNGVTWYCRGQTTYGGGVDVTPRTLFEIGSITKAFTGILFADMLERGEVRPEDPIEKYLPADVKAPTRGGKHITLLSLAQHRSGLPRLPGNFDEATHRDNPYSHYDTRQVFEFLSGCTLDRDIGGQYEYSNLGMGLLGQLLSRAAGKPYEKLLSERVLKPLGLKDTLISLDAAREKRLAPGHNGSQQTRAWDFDCLAPCGALRSSGEDMISFLTANLGIRKTPLAAALARSLTPRVATGMSHVEIALGWHISTAHDTEIIWHNGGTAGTRSFCGFVPSKKLGVVVLTNSSESADDIGLHLLEHKYKLRRIQKSADVPRDVLAAYQGYYELAPGSVIHVTVSGDTLYAQLTGQDAYPVYPKSPTEFAYRVVEARLTFERDADGRATRVTLHQNGREMPAQRLPDDYQPPAPRKEKAVGVDVLRKYVGRYELRPGVTFDVRLEGKQLTVQLTGQPRIPVFAESTTKFFYNVVDAQITFVADDKGDVNKLILHQGGQNQPATRVSTTGE